MSRKSFAIEVLNPAGSVVRRFFVEGEKASKEAARKEKQKALRCGNSVRVKPAEEVEK